MEGEGGEAAPAPTGRPRYTEPAAQAASSMTAIPRGSQSARMASRSAGTPAWSTRMTARVRSVSVRFDRLRGQVLGRGVDIGEDRLRADVADRRWRWR